SVTTSGVEKVVAPVCCGPEGGVEVLNGKLYGTTSDDGSPNGGTVFSLTTSGTQQTLHSFTGGLNGGSPEDPLSVIGNVFYGTTRLAGKYGGGTIFRINP
ncbi:MAG TPA: choice-of-anchor tandem repeat GloVer-containing protein, partial [Candidatus Baltobacteraceae bacterium]|nr:choice-of-anchor tandem repeat GloVer-containing protein [Candidatus Baltobacteraceae bacterium]